jgi:hypothetical protein
MATIANVSRSQYHFKSRAIYSFSVALISTNKFTAIHLPTVSGPSARLPRLKPAAIEQSQR